MIYILYIYILTLPTPEFITNLLHTHTHTKQYQELKVHIRTRLVSDIHTLSTAKSKKFELTRCT